MSETPPLPANPDDNLADVVDLDARRHGDDDERLDPYELSDAEAANFFVSQLLHPGRQHSTAELGEYIGEMLGPFTKDDISDEGVMWRTRLLGLMVDVDRLDDEQLGILLENDSITRDLYAALIETRERSRGMKAERSALLLLRELRAGMVAREDTDPVNDVRWQRLIDMLKADKGDA